MRILRPVTIVATLALLWAAPAQSQAPSSPRLTFIKVFEGSLPEYTRVSVDQNGRGLYQGGTAKEPEEPEEIQLSAALTGRLFDLAAQLNHFRGLALEEPQRVAYMGQKTFIYEDGSGRAEVAYNYTRNQTAEALRLLFEGVGRGRYLVHQLEHRQVFDRLGLVEVLGEFERDLNARRLVDLEQFAPVLEKIAADGRLMALARSRARELLRRVQGGPASLILEHGDQNAGWYYKLAAIRGGVVTFEGRRFDAAPNPRIVTLPAGVSERLWELTELAEYFRGMRGYREPAGRLNGYRFTFEYGPEHNEVVFTTPPTAAVSELTHILQQVLQQEYYRERLEKALKEESFMLQVVLQELEAAVGADKLLDPAEFAPILASIVDGEKHHPVVRERAQRLLAHIRPGGS